MSAAQECLMRYVRTLALIALLALAGAAGAQAMYPQLVPNGMTSR